MPSMIDDGADWIAGMLADYAGANLVYRRLAMESDPFVGTCSLNTDEVIDEETGLPTTIEYSDWIIRRSLLVLGGEVIDPRPGDRLVNTDTLQEFEVVAIGKRPCFKTADTGGVMVIIHTIEVE